MGGVKFGILPKLNFFITNQFISGRLGLTTVLLATWLRAQWPEILGLKSTH
jgi:hypothetical protein